MPIRKRFLLAFTALAFSVTLVAQSIPGVTLERNATMKTRDGVTLVADVYRPADGQKHAVLLTRTPYNKDNMAPIGMKAAQRGFVVVIQDTRGRFNSDGEWYPFKHESADGYDAVEWAAALPGSDGRVGMFSGSYVGATQMLAAIAQPPHLAGICPVVTASNYHENWTYQGGAFEQWFSQSWTSGLARDTTTRLVDESSNARMGEQTLPLTEFPVFNLGPGPIEIGASLTKKLAPYYEDWLAHPTYDDYWKQWSIEENYQNIQVPALTIAAWYDIFLGGSLRNYIGLRDHAGNAEARAKQRLVVAIGGHSAGTAGSAPWTSALKRPSTKTKSSSSGTNTSSSASRTSSLTAQNRCGSSSWARTSGALRPHGPRPKRSLFTITSSPRAGPTPPRATDFCLRPPSPARRTVSSTTRPTQFPPSAAHSAATRSTFRPVRATSGR